jgi:hypothetical protein
MRRATLWDGVYPLDFALPFSEQMAPQGIVDALSYLAPYRTPGAPFEVVHMGISAGADAAQDRALVAEYAKAGVTWWLENFAPQRFQGDWGNWPLEQMRQRMRQGPPK